MGIVEAEELLTADEIANAVDRKVGRLSCCPMVV